MDPQIVDNNDLDGIIAIHKLKLVDFIPLD